MIHSMSGGIIADNGYYTFAKVEIAGTPYWYLSPFSVTEGDRVLVPYQKSGCAEGVVKKVEVCSNQCAPVPMNRIKAIERVLPKT